MLMERQIEIMRLQLGSDLLIDLRIKNNSGKNCTLNVEVVHVFHQSTFDGKSEE